MSDVTQIPSAIEAGDPSAAEQLLPLIYDELRKLAEQRPSSHGSIEDVIDIAGIRATLATRHGRSANRSATSCQINPT